MRTFDRDMGKVKSAAERLAAANISFQVALDGDEVVDFPLQRQVLSGYQRVLVLAPKDFPAADQEVLASIPSTRRFETLESALSGLEAAVRVEPGVKVRVFPRVKPGAAAIHLVNWGYDAASDKVQPLSQLRLQVDLQKLGVAQAREATLVAPGAAPVKLPVKDGAVEVPRLDLWGIIELK